MVERNKRESEREREKENELHEKIAIKIARINTFCLNRMAKTEIETERER